LLVHGVLVGHLCDLSVGRESHPPVAAPRWWRECFAFCSSRGFQSWVVDLADSRHGA
jgi:hypothetical protein